MSVAIVAMVNNSALSEISKAHSDSCPGLLVNSTTDKNSSRENHHSLSGEINWSPTLQGYVLGSYYVTYMVVQIPSGILVERYGCKKFFFWGTAAAALGKLLIPLASKYHAYAVIVLQIVRGLGHGFYQPASAVLTVNWFPKQERGFLFSFLHSGACFGTFLVSIFSGFVSESALLGGWPCSFYILGITGLILAVVIQFFLHESPSVHPKISPAELQYILDNQENTLSLRRPDTPWSKIFRSLPVYALAIGYFGQFWAISQFLIVNSTFLGTVLHYSMQENGLLSALPFLIMFIFMHISNCIARCMTDTMHLSVNLVRKFWSLMASVGVSCSYVGMIMAGCNRSWNIALACLSLGFAGFGQSGVWVVAPDMSPTFAATINAICVTAGFLSSSILPLIVGYETNEMNTIQQWHKVFFISIWVVMGSGIAFCVFGSADIQPWNFVKEASSQKNDQVKDAKSPDEGKNEFGDEMLSDSVKNKFKDETHL